MNKQNDFFERAKCYAPSFVRIALALVFLWFGINQLMFPNDFMGYLPSWTIHDGTGLGHLLYTAVSILPGKANSVIFINGVAEIILGTLLGIGLFTRISALLLSIHLLIIVFSLGYNDIAIRDLGLVAGAFSVFIHGPDCLCIEKK